MDPGAVDDQDSSMKYVATKSERLIFRDRTQSEMVVETLVCRDIRNCIVTFCTKSWIVCGRSFSWPIRNFSERVVAARSQTYHFMEENQICMVQWRLELTPWDKDAQVKTSKHTTTTRVWCKVLVVSRECRVQM